MFGGSALEGEGARRRVAWSERAAGQWESGR